MKTKVRTIVFYLCCFMCLSVTYCKAQECNYTVLFNKAMVLAKQNHNYTEAIRKLNSAKACSPDKSVQVDAKIQWLFNELKQQQKREETLRKTTQNTLLTLQKEVARREAVEDSLKKAHLSTLAAEENTNKVKRKARVKQERLRGLIKNGASKEVLAREIEDMGKDDSGADTAKSTTTVPDPQNSKNPASSTDSSSAKLQLNNNEPPVIRSILILHATMKYTPTRQTKKQSWYFKSYNNKQCLPLTNKNPEDNFDSRVFPSYKFPFLNSSTA